MEDFRIYLCGGMSKFGAENFELGDKWRRYCKKTLEECEANYNVRVTNPNDFYNLKSDETYDSHLEVLEFDLNRVRKSDLIICNFNDPSSLGTMAELAIAYEHRIPVVGLLEDECELHPWQVEFCNKLFDNIDYMLDYVEDYYLK